MHTERYLDSLNSSGKVAEIAEVPVGFLPNFLLQWRLLSPMRWATQGTIDATKLALAKGVGINLGGGYHHARPDAGGGFCFYADIPLAIKKLRETNPNLAVMYVDLDAHQGNGVEWCMDGDPNWYTLDCYKERNYPYQRDGKYPTQKIDKPLTERSIYCENCTESGVRATCQNCNTKYLQSLREALPAALNEFQQKHSKKPDLIFYNAGTDCFESDRLGGMNVNRQGIIDRDEFVFQQAQTNNIPICMTTSGGYTSESASLIGASIINLHQKGLLTHP